MDESKKNDIKKLFQIIREEMGVSKEQIISDDRKSIPTNARYILCAAFKLKFNMTAKESGRILNRHHASILNGLYQFHNRYLVEDTFKVSADKVFSRAEIDYKGYRMTDYKS